MNKAFTYKAICNVCNWTSGYSVKTYVDEEVKRHKDSECPSCDHPYEMSIKHVLSNKTICVACNTTIDGI